MKAAVYDGKNVSIKNIPIPQLLESQALIRVKAAGICGTDIAIIKGNLPTPIPLILGHEFSGEIVKVGKNVDSSWIGKRVTCEINSKIDRDCFFCKRGIFTQCISRKAIGIDINGAFSEYVAVEPYLLHEIPSTLSFEEANFIEPLAAAYQTFEMMPLDRDDKVMVIFGQGKLGILITQVALLQGLNVIVVDGSEKKLEISKKLGANNCINRLKIDNVSKKVRDLTNGLGADISVDTTGNADAINDVVSSCRTRGKLHVKSTHGLQTLINLTDIVVRELILYSSRCGPFEKAIEGLTSGKISVKELITKKFKLEEISEAFASYEKSRDHIKTILLM